GCGGARRMEYGDSRRPHAGARAAAAAPRWRAALASVPRRPGAQRAGRDHRVDRVGDGRRSAEGRGGGARGAAGAWRGSWGEIVGGYWGAGRDVGHGVTRGG